jgi:hypothetical protein
MIRFCTLALILALLPLSAGNAQDVNPSVKEEKDKRQIDWVGDWDSAFKQAKERNRIVMLCINSKDGEVANERAASKTYKDEDFVALTRKFVMVVVSTRNHAGMFGTCKRFGGVTCTQHVDCYKFLRNKHGDQFLIEGGEMISPQHAFFAGDGRLLWRKEYELTKAQLMKQMRTVLAGAKDLKEGGDAPDGGAGADPVDRPLSEKDKAQLDYLKTTKKEDQRHVAVGNLLNTGKRSARAALVDLLLGTKKTGIKCAILRGLGKANVVDAREAIEGMLNDKDELVRSFAAVALEELQQAASIEPLLKRAKRERNRYGRKNMYRALAKCAGPSAHAKAAKALLKAASSDKQQMVRKHAAAALKAYQGEKGSKLVKKPLERLALKEKDAWVRGALVYSLAYIGDEKTSLPVLQTLLEKTNSELSKGWIRQAIQVLRKRGGFRGTWWLWSEDRDDPAREVEDRGRGRGGR